MWYLKSHLTDESNRAVYLFWPANDIFVVKSSFKTPLLVYPAGLELNLHPYFMYANSDGFDNSVQFIHDNIAAAVYRHAKFPQVRPSQ